MEVTQAQYDAFIAQRDEAAKVLGTQALTNNPNVTYEQILSPQELQSAAIVFSPELNASATEIFDANTLTKIKTSVDWDNRVKPYNRAPIEYDMYERHPEYMKQVDYFNSGEGQQRSQEAFARGNYPDDYRPLEPQAPFGIEKAKKIATLGFEPSKELTFDNFGDQAGFRSKIGLAPRRLTKEDIKYIGDQYGLDGTYRYINPSDPSLGLVFKAKGSDEEQLINTPYVTAEDTYKFLINEVPAIAGDIALLTYGAKKFEPLLKGAAAINPGLIKRTGQVLGISGLSAVGAAGGDFLRLSAGYVAGAHDRDFMDILKESGMIGSLAFAGTAAIGVATNIIPKMWRNITGKDVPNEFYEKIDNLMKQVRASEAGINPTKAKLTTSSDGILYGNAGSVKEIQDAIKLLSERTGKEFKQYNPTLASATGRLEAADLEMVFLKNADDPELAALYQQIKLGNQQVIDDFLRALNDEVGPNLATSGATGATTSGGIRNLVEEDILAFEDTSRAAITSMRNNLIGAEDPALAGQTLLKQVEDVRAGDSMFPRTRTRLNEIRENYIKPYNQAWSDALNNPQYADLTTGAGFTRTPATSWSKASKKESDQLLRSLDSKESKDVLMQMLGTEGGAVLKRLQGLGKEGFENPAFTLQELNNARVVLNDFASNNPNLKGAVQYARNLERGIEKQINSLIDDGAKTQMDAQGIKVTKNSLRDFKQQTGYGEDLKSAWANQKEAIQLSNTEVFRSLNQQQPEKVVDFLLGSSTSGSNVNTRVNQLMTVLRKEGSDEVLDIQKGIATYVQRNILDQADKTPLQIARDYREFMKLHRGTLKEIFGDNYKMFDFNPKQFQNNVIKQLEQTETTIARMRARFGSATNPNPSAANVVELLLETGKTQKLSGQVLEDQRYLMSLIKNNPELKEQIAAVTKRYINQSIIKPKQGLAGGTEIDPQALNRLLTEGFGPLDVTGPVLTFDNFITPLLGKEGKEYIKLFKTFNNLVQREIGPATSSAAEQSILREAPATKIEYIKKFIIPPLTQFGRRVNAAEKRINEGSKRFIGEMLLDPDLFRMTLNYAEGRVRAQNFIRFLTSYGTVATQDLANDLDDYDTETKTQPKRKVTTPLTEEVVDTAVGAFQ